MSLSLKSFCPHILLEVYVAEVCLKDHESLLVYQFLAFVKLGPFHISEKGFYLDKFHVIINILQVQLDCCDLTNFGRSGQIFKRTAIVSLNFKTEHLYFVDTLLILEFLSR